MLILAAALAQTTRVFETDADALAWLRASAAHVRELPVVAPPDADRLPLDGRRIWLVPHRADQDPEQIALDVRMQRGLPCAAMLEPLAEGWVGWTHGHCGLRFIGAWRVVDDRVLDDRDRRVTIPQFAADVGDVEVLRVYKRLDRMRGRGIWNAMLGSGMLYVSGIALSRSGERAAPGWIAFAGAGGALTLAGVAQVAWAQADPRSRPRRLDAFWDEDEIQRRVIAHNHRFRMVWTLGPGAAGVTATF